ncbi:hypothetical protein NQ314_017715 [Rhamnusium bicolor]|uniref:lysozyme n=1 Tax=Rhamnusium bicolor TaxID=1586634 RepID=A0AAV8WT52_9CUCU|nr:hypothetical protein NQ314_017715 [Rhamnusium bicolor]
MYNFSTILLILFSVSFSSSEGKVYGRCEFARHLLKHGVPKWQIPTWTCIARHESEYDTTKINHNTGDHGILQISQLYWCSNNNQPGKACKKTCSKFRDNYIGDDIACAKKNLQ